MSDLSEGIKDVLHGVGEGLADALTWPHYEPHVVLDDWHRHWWDRDDVPVVIHEDHPVVVKEYVEHAHEDLRRRFGAPPGHAWGHMHGK